MKKFVISGLLGLGFLAGSFAAHAGSMSCASGTCTWSEFSPDAPANLPGQTVVGFNNVNTNIITGNLNANGENDNRDTFKFTWQGNGSGNGAAINISVTFSEIDRWTNTEPPQNDNMLFTVDLIKLLSPNNPLGKVTDDSIFVLTGTTSPILYPPDAPNTVTLPALTLTNTALNTGCASASTNLLCPGDYFLRFTQSEGGYAKYTATFAAVPRDNNNNHVPEPGTLGLMMLGLSATFFKKRRC